MLKIGDHVKIKHDSFILHVKVVGIDTDSSEANLLPRSLVHYIGQDYTGAYLGTINFTQLDIVG